MHQKLPSNYLGIYIDFRRQRTAEEAQKLAHVQTELQKIDLLVAQDVKILRQTIEVASVEYMQAK